MQAQRFVRGFLARKRFLTARRGVVLLQSHFRRRKAKAEFRVLKACARELRAPDRTKPNQTKANLLLSDMSLVESLYVLCFALQIEARSTDGLKKVNVGLENKIIELQQRLDERVRCCLSTDINLLYCTVQYFYFYSNRCTRTYCT